MSKTLFDKIDFQKTMKNMFTSGSLKRCRMPLFFETDEETIRAAIYDAFRSDPAQCVNARVMRIKNTLEIESLWVSANILAELTGQESITVGRRRRARRRRLGVPYCEL